MSNYKHGGYEKKYIIKKTNGHPIDPFADYFVLRLDTDPHALEALRTYAESVVSDNPRLSFELGRLITINQTIQNAKATKEE